MPFERREDCHDASETTIRQSVLLLTSVATFPTAESSLASIYVLCVKGYVETDHQGVVQLNSTRCHHHQRRWSNAPVFNCVTQETWFGMAVEKYHRLTAFLHWGVDIFPSRSFPESRWQKLLPNDWKFPNNDSRVIIFFRFLFKSNRFFFCSSSTADI